MRHLANKKLDHDLEKASLRVIVREVGRINSVDDLSLFFRKYFTDSEKDMLIRRAAISVLLENGTSYRKIGNLLEVSQGTISRARDLVDGRGYGRNSERKGRYTPSFSKARKEKKIFKKYKGAESII